MTLLNGGIRSTFGRVFGAIYEGATLIKVATSHDIYGNQTETETEYPVKAHAPSRNEAYRAAAGFSEGEIEIIILKDGVTVTPDADDRLKYDGKTYDITRPSEDGAHSHWRIRARARNTGDGASTGGTGG